MTKEQFLAQYDWQPGDRVLCSVKDDPDSLFLGYTDGFYFDDKVFHSLIRLIDGKPVEVKPREQIEQGKF